MGRRWWCWLPQDHHVLLWSRAMQRKQAFHKCSYVDCIANMLAVHCASGWHGGMCSAVPLFRLVGLAIQVVRPCSACAAYASLNLQVSNQADTHGGHPWSHMVLCVEKAPPRMCAYCLVLALTCPPCQHHYADISSAGALHVMHAQVCYSHQVQTFTPPTAPNITLSHWTSHK